MYPKVCVHGGSTALLVRANAAVLSYLESTHCFLPHQIRWNGKTARIEQVINSKK